MSGDRVRTIRSAALDAGLALVVIGIGCFDFRFGIIAAGGVLAAAALWGMSKDARNAPRNRRR